MRITSLSRAVHALIMGPPGSGKGTVASRMKRDLAMETISSGDILRTEMENESRNGLVAKKYIESGNLVPDQVMIELILSIVHRIPKKTSWVLDGFPRTVSQAESLAKEDRIDTVINLDVPFQTIMDRVSSRWIHLPSGRVYNVDFNPPQVPGFDDVTGEKLVQREDDKPEIVKKRLKTYQEATQPLLDYYKEKKLLQNFQGTETDKIWPYILKYFRSEFRL